MRIAVIGGTGYVGLTSAACLASEGHFVFCVGRNEDKIAKLEKGIPVIYEEGLQGMLRNVLSQDRFVPTTDLEASVLGSEASFICVGTPSRKDGNIDLSQIREVSKDIGRALRKKREYHVVTTRSTVVPGTTEGVVLRQLEDFSGKKAGSDFGLCMNPEFLREGKALEDFLRPKGFGIVVGELDGRSGDSLFEIYKDFGVEILRTDIRTAEMIKYARNSYLAKDISFANEIANLCQRLGVDYELVKKGMLMDYRIGPDSFLNAGVGFGGSCFPKDVKAIIAKAGELGFQPRILEATIQTNEMQPLKAVQLLEQVLGEVKGKKIAVLGLAFKPGTDDMREAASVKIIKSLLLQGVRVVGYDPKAVDNAKKIVKGEDVHFVRSVEEALREADGCIIVTEWREFADPDIYLSMRGRVIIDGRRVLDPNDLPEGFLYHGIGLPEMVQT